MPACADAALENRVAPAASPLVDLSREDFSGGRIVLVPTRWDFYWKRFLAPGDFARNAKSKPAPDARYTGMRPWTAKDAKGRSFPGRGFGTYRMLLRLPPGVRYGFRIQQQLMAFRLYANGRLLIRAGRAGRSKAETFPQRRQNNFYITAGKEPAEIILHVSNYHMFRGGLRGILVVGEHQALDIYARRKIALDFILIGFLSAVALYHLVFFFMHSRQWSFALFALICVTFALRIPFMSEKTVHLFLPGTPWYAHLRLLGSINILAPPLLIFFLRSVFPDRVGWKSVLPYLIPCALFFGVQFLDFRYLAPAMFLAYTLVLLPALVHAIWITASMSLRGSAGALIIMVGLCVTTVFGLIAMYLNWRAADAAPVALLTFAVSVLLQSAGLGRTYRDELNAREVLRERLARSRKALAEQRKELEINLHDSIGGALTDFQITLDRGRERLAGDRDFHPEELLNGLREGLDRTNKMFRGQLLFMEDMDLVARDPVIGLQMMLLRRYADGGREIDFRIEPDAKAAYHAAMGEDEWRFQLLQLTRELCTNDLKYGAGESHWLLRERERALEIQQSNALRGESSSGGVLARRARERVEKMGGSFQANTREGRFEVLARLPFAR